MEIIDLAEKRKAFTRSKNRYERPHKEAMKLRLLWTYHKRSTKSRDNQEVRNSYREACTQAQKDGGLRNVSLLTKGLLLDPKFHGFYALRGDMYMRQGKWTQAIKNYEDARKTVKYDSKLTEAQRKILYNRQLVESYTKRGDSYCDDNLLLEALSDYEQVLILKLRGMSTIAVQDKLLEILRKLNKYDAFRFYWNTFITDADTLRASDLLARYAEYKIHLRDMAAARHILLEALDLNNDNVQARELLQVVYNSGHTMAAYTVIWCLHGCYDKALLTIEKGRDCDPYNPGFTLLKTIVLRLSGRLTAAESWLENVDKDFSKLLEPSRDKQGSIMGKLTRDETRSELIKQWYLIRYDMAMKYILNGNHEEASRIVRGSNLTTYYTEPYILLGDTLLKHGKTDLALDTYLHCRERRRELHLPPSRKTIDLAERIIDILNDRAKMATREKLSKDVIDITDKALRILDEDHIKNHQLPVQRGRALFYKARGLFQISTKGNKSKKQCCETATDSLRFIREDVDTDLYRSLYSDLGMEEIIDRFPSKRNLPRSLKILMQYS